MKRIALAFALCLAALPARAADITLSPQEAQAVYQALMQTPGGRALAVLSQAQARALEQARKKKDEKKRAASGNPTPLRPEE